MKMFHINPTSNKTNKMTSWLLNDRYSTSLLIIYSFIHRERKLNKSFRFDRKDDGSQSRCHAKVEHIPALNFIFCVHTCWSLKFATCKTKWNQIRRIKKLEIFNLEFNREQWFSDLCLYFWLKNIHKIIHILPKK